MVRVRCPRCGLFEISGTALAMLGSRVEQDPLTRARLSHAIRSRTSENNTLFVSSTNLDELGGQPLPGIPQQLQRLIVWLAAELGDDQLGRIPCPWPETLAGLIGAADGERVDRLIAYAVKQGLVEHDAERDVLGLTPDGWKMAGPTDNEEVLMPRASPAETPAKSTKANCNNCGGERNAHICASYTVNDGDDLISWSDTYEILQCPACLGLSVRRSYWFSEWDDYDSDPLTGQERLVPGVEVTYWPPKTKRKKPEWVERLEDEELCRVADEVFQALNMGLIVLASIGVRTLLDRAMFLCIGDPSGGFAGKLSLMVEKGYIGNEEREALEAVTDAGSAAAHRAFAPSPEMLDKIVAMVESFLLRTFVLKAVANEVRAVIPPRRHKNPSATK